MPSVVFVLDASVLLADPAAFRRFAEHEVVIPLAVIDILEHKAETDPEVAENARSAIRALELLREEHGTLDTPRVVNKDGGTVRVELNHVDDTHLPARYRAQRSSSVIAVALNLHEDSYYGTRVVLVARSLSMRVKAAGLGIDVENYRGDRIPHDELPGIVRIDVDDEVVTEIADTGVVRLAELAELKPNTGAIVVGQNLRTVVRMDETGKAARCIQNFRELDISPKGAEQTVALNLLMDNSVQLVSLSGPAGSGKSLLAIAAACGQVIEGEYDKIIVIRPIEPVGSREIGYLPGDESEKMAPWRSAVDDVLSMAVSENVRHMIDMDQQLEVIPTTFLRGRTFNRSFVIIDEAQNLEKTPLLTALSRIGEGSKVVLTYDVSQRDNLHVGKHDGVTALVSELIGDPLVGHVTLNDVHRSRVAKLVSKLDLS